jgi:hypothetical protein
MREREGDEVRRGGAANEVWIPCSRGTQCTWHMDMKCHIVTYSHSLVVDQRNMISGCVHNPTAQIVGGMCRKRVN